MAPSSRSVFYLVTETEDATGRKSYTVTAFDPDAVTVRDVSHHSTSAEAEAECKRLDPLYATPAEANARLREEGFFGPPRGGPKRQ